METWTKARRLVAGLVILIAVLIAYHVLGIGCPIRFLTGVSCPGCGMTRAWLSVLSLRFDMAMAYHPLFWLVPVIIAVMLMRDRMGQRCYTVFLVLGISAIVAVWVVRLALNPDTCLAGPYAIRQDIVSIGPPAWVHIVYELLAP